MLVAVIRVSTGGTLRYFNSNRRVSSSSGFVASSPIGHCDANIRPASRVKRRGDTEFIYPGRWSTCNMAAINAFYIYHQLKASPSLGSWICFYS